MRAHLAIALCLGLAGCAESLPEPRHPAGTPERGLDDDEPAPTPDFDQDDDGITDEHDACPTVADTDPVERSYDGCPDSAD